MIKLKELRKQGYNFLQNRQFFCDRCNGTRASSCSGWVYDHGCGKYHMSCAGCIFYITRNITEPIENVSCYYCDNGLEPSCLEYDFEYLYEELSKDYDLSK